MGLTTNPPYKRLNKTTGLWEWVYPEPQEYDKSDRLKPLNVKTPKKKRRK